MTVRASKLVLASASPRRLQLLRQIGVEPDGCRPTAIDETPRRAEKPRDLALRLADAKAAAAVAALSGDDALVLAADTVVAVGRRVLPKSETEDEARACLTLLSGRGHRVFTAIALRSIGRSWSRISETRVAFKRLSGPEIEAYLRTGEWRGKAGGYAIQGLAGSFVIRLVGSYSGVVGLPLYEVANLLEGAGCPVRRSWSSEGMGDEPRDLAG